MTPSTQAQVVAEEEDVVPFVVVVAAVVVVTLCAVVGVTREVVVVGAAVVVVVGAAVVVVVGASVVVVVVSAAATETGINRASAPTAPTVINRGRVLRFTMVPLWPSAPPAGTCSTLMDRQRELRASQPSHLPSR